MMAEIPWQQIHSIVSDLAEAYDEIWRQRKRKIGTSFLLVFLMRICFSRSQSGYQIVIDEIWDSMRKAGLALPQEKPFAASSVCEARAKLDPFIISEMNSSVVDSFLALNHDRFRWNGFRLFVVDGSTVHLPPELKVEGFGGMNPGMHYPQGKLSVLLHVGSGAVVDVLLDHKGNERDLAARHINVLLPGEDAVIYDRGYFSYELALTHIRKGVEGIFRMPLSGCTKSIQDFIDDPLKPQERVISISPTVEQRTAIRKKNRLFVFSPCKLRVIRYFIDGQEYVISTTILDEKIDSAEFGNVYHERWCVEEHYKMCKAILSLELFHAKSLRGVLQEIFTAELFLTLSRLVAIESETLLSAVTDEKKTHQNLSMYVARMLGKLKPQKKAISRQKSQQKAKRHAE